MSIDLGLGVSLGFCICVIAAKIVWMPSVGGDVDAKGVSFSLLWLIAFAISYIDVP